MEKYRKTEILQIVEEEGVEFIRLQFTDMFGTLKNVAVPVSCLEKAMDDRCTIDLASLNGFAKKRRQSCISSRIFYVYHTAMASSEWKSCPFSV